MRSMIAMRVRTECFCPLPLFASTRYMKHTKAKRDLGALLRQLIVVQRSAGGAMGKNVREPYLHEDHARE
jgi:hypothetical protein